MLHDDRLNVEQHPEPLSTSRQAVVVSSEMMEEVQRLYDDGLYVQAHRKGLEAGPLEFWRGAPAMVLAGRLATNLGNHRLSRVLLQRAYRLQPDDAETSYYYIYSRLERLGPLEAWQLMQGMGDWPNATPELRADWLSLKAQIASCFRDHFTVERLLKQSEELTALRPWFCVVKSGVLQSADRYDEALAWTQKGLALKPWHRASIIQQASLLRLMDRDDEAEASLKEAACHLESGTIYALLARMNLDKAQLDASFLPPLREYLDLYVASSPMLDREERKWVDMMLADLAYLEGDIVTFLLKAKASKSKFHDEVVGPRLAANSEGKRVLLDVPYVRQHRNTCAPATLAALAKYWKRSDVEHLRLAASICYDGTPDHAERHWAENNGWLAREFTVTWDCVRSLIDRGVPFTLTTIEPGAGHLQAVIGYDERRGTILIRDPATPSLNEMDQAGGLKRYAAYGPRGMALVPLEETARLDGLELPDVPRYDAVFRLQRALELHRRDVAQQEYQVLEQQGKDHRLVHCARRLLAHYDDDQVSGLAAISALLALSPDNTTLRLAQLSSMVGLARRSERLEKLREYNNDHDADPIFGQMLASELADDAREQGLARRLLRRVIRTRPSLAASYVTLADLQWGLMKRNEALELYRIATCLDDKVESYARSYFNAAVCLNKTDSALGWLRDRLAGTLALSSQPAKTLYWAYDRLNQSKEAFAVLEEALAARPEDAELKLFASDAWLQRGEIDRAIVFLEQAREKAARTRWLRSKAFLEDSRGDLPAALNCWEAILAIEPLSADAHRTATRLRAEINGKDAALAELNRLVELYPHHYGLQALRIEWLREDTPQHEKAVCRMMEHYPDDGWLQREYANCLCDQNQLDQAIEAVEHSIRVDPFNPAGLAFRGRIFARQGKYDKASEDYLAAIKLDIDYAYSQFQYVELAQNRDDRLARLRQIAAELQRQFTQGDGISHFQEAAGDSLDASEILSVLRELWQKRQQLWQAWSCYAGQLLDMAARINHEEAAHQQYLQEALQVARTASEKFPLLPGAWTDLARIHRFMQNGAEEINALEQARKLNPNWGQAARQLADALERQGKLDEAQTCLEQIVARVPLDPVNHARLGDFFSSHDRKEDAVGCYRTAILHSPGNEYSWEALRQLAVDLKQPDLALSIARDLTERRPREARSWLMLADSLVSPEQLEEKLQALDKAAGLNPTLSDIYDKKAEALAETGRYEEALAACQPAVTVSTPRHLEGRHAWVLWKMGKQDEAIEKLEKVLAEDAHYFWAVRQLLQWYQELPEKQKEYARWAEHLTKIAPKFPAGFGYHGDALLRLNQRDDAKQAYRRALQIDASYTYAGMSLFDEQFTDQEWDDAEKTLELMEQNGPDPFIQARRVQLLSKHRSTADRDKAIEALRSICVSCPAHNNWPIDTAAGAIWEAAWRPQLKSGLQSVLGEEHVHPFTANMLLRVVCLHDGLREADDMLAHIRSNHPQLESDAYQGVFFYLEAERQHRKNYDFIRDHEERICSETHLWGMAGGIYAADEKAGYRAARSLLSDFALRTDGKPWMLLNYVTSSVALGYWQEAEAASRHALTWEPDNTTNMHRVWLALHAVLRNDREQAESNLAACERIKLDALHGYLAKAVEASLSILHGNLSWKMFRAQLRSAAQIHQPVLQDRPALRAARKKLVQYVASKQFGWSGWFKAYGMLTKETMPASGGKTPTPVTNDSNKNSGWANWVYIIMVLVAFSRIVTSCGSSSSNSTMPPVRPNSFKMPTIPSLRGGQAKDTGPGQVIDALLKEALEKRQERK